MCMFKYSGVCQFWMAHSHMMNEKFVVRWKTVYLMVLYCMVGMLFHYLHCSFLTPLLLPAGIQTPGKTTYKHTIMYWSYAFFPLFFSPFFKNLRSYFGKCHVPSETYWHTTTTEPVIVTRNHIKYRFASKLFHSDSINASLHEYLNKIQGKKSREIHLTIFSFTRWIFWTLITQKNTVNRIIVIYSCCTAKGLWKRIALCLNKICF